MVRLALPALLALALAALSACGDTRHKDEAIAQRLRQPGTTWEQLNPVEQQEALSTCRLGEAVAVARDDGANLGAVLLQPLRRRPSPSRAMRCTAA